MELRFHEVSDLHRGFFADPDTLGPLGEALGACLGDTAQVVVSYDSAARVGRITLEIPPGASACLPTAQGGGWDVSPLEPVGVSLARYRDTVASKFDFRVASFRVGASFTRGAAQCKLWLAGTHPPDGRSWSPCVEINGVSACGEGDRKLGVTRVALPEHQATLRRCFRR